MTIQEVLEKVHIRFEKNTDYPDTTSEDFIVRREYADQMITLWEKQAREGQYWPVLKSSASFPTGGTGTDSIASNVPDFLCFLRPEQKPAVISDGSREWTEVSMATGNREAQQANNAFIFWEEGGNIRTLPALSGTMSFPYIRKATRYPVGTETTPIEIGDEQFLIEGILALLFLDDGNTNQYNAHMNNAKDMLDTMTIQTLNTPPEDSEWGFGL